MAQERDITTPSYFEPAFAEVDPPYEDEDGITHWPDDTDDKPANDLDDFDDNYYDDCDDCIDDDAWGYDPEW